MAEPRGGDDSYTPPRIDLAPFLLPLDDKHKQATAQQLRQACQSDGLFLVPFPPSLAASAPAALASVNALFALPSETKQTLPLVSTQGFVRGYIPLFGESGLKGEYQEGKEGFSYGHPWEEEEGTAPSNPLQGPNQWPSGAAAEALGGAEWRAALERLFADLVQVAEALVRALSLALGREEGYLAGVCEGGETISLVRAFHYLPLAQMAVAGAGGKAIGSSPHTDWGFLTLIVQDGVVGLQFLQRNGEEEEKWVDVPAAEGCLLFNVGDFLSLLSARLLQEEQGGGAGQQPFHSPVHRVMLSSQERTSLVFFYYPNFDTPLPSTVGSRNAGKEGEAAYNTLLDGGEKKEEGKEGRVVTFGQHLMRKWAGVAS